MPADMLWLAAAAAIAGIAVLRWSWGVRGRATLLNALGWSLLAASVVIGGYQAGAWGIAVTSLIAMLAAALCLAQAGFVSSGGRPARITPRRIAAPDEEGGRRIGARLLTFLVVVLGGLAAAIAFAIGVRVALLAIGWTEADANASALIVVPVAWGVLSTALLMQHHRRTQVVTLAIAGLPILPALLVGN